MQQNGFTSGKGSGIVRAHFTGEDQNHHSLDTPLAEGGRPGIEADEPGMLAGLYLRRIARTLALFS